MNEKKFNFSTACAKSILSLGAFIALASLSTSALSGEAKMHTTVTIKADNSLEYAGFCSSDQLPERMRFSGQGARSFTVEGAQVRCELEILAGGSLLVLEMTGAAGNRTRTSTRGVGSKIRLKTG